MRISDWSSDVCSSDLDSGSIRKAAERLNLSQPALSKGIKDFERRLGMELLHRGRSGAVLTAPAREIVKRGRQILLLTERTRVVPGKRVSVRVDPGGSRIMNKKKKQNTKADSKH